MLITDGFDDKLIHIFIGVLAAVIVCFAWWTTNTNDRPPYHTVFLLDRRFRRRITHTRLTTQIQTTSITAADSEQATASVESSNNLNASTSSLERNKPQASNSTSASTSTEPSVSSNLDNIHNNQEEELATIVQIMDADANVVRLRRLAYYENQTEDFVNADGNGVSSTEAQTSSSNVGLNSATAGDDNEEIINEPIMEHNYAEHEPMHCTSPNENILEELETTDAHSAQSSENGNNTNIRIKLKYLNDELKLVDGRLEEQLGEFKRRHFHPEFSSNKLVRLIFNGQVLQPDTETLQNCGLFDNCVVHCLIHQQRNVFNDATDNSGYTSSNMRGSSTGLPQSNNNQGRDWDLGNVLFFLVSIILGSAWYFRYEYAHLYTVTATVALAAITGIFTIFLVGIYFPDTVPPRPQPERQSVST